jgi:hypothetical protein
MAVAAWAGKWSRGGMLVGIWMALISLAIFAVFAALFGDTTLKYVGAGIMLLMGVFMLLRSFTKKPTE